MATPYASPPLDPHGRNRLEHGRVGTAPNRALVQRAVSSIRIHGLRGFLMRVVARLVAASVTRSARKAAATYALLVARVRRQFEQDARSSLADFLGDPAARLCFAVAFEPTVSRPQPVLFEQSKLLSVARNRCDHAAARKRDRNLLRFFGGGRTRYGESGESNEARSH